MDVIDDYDVKVPSSSLIPHEDFPQMIPLRRSLRCLGLVLASVAGSPWAESGRQGATPMLEDLLEMRVSSAARRLQTPAEAPSMVKVITAGEIHRLGWRTLGEALASLPGLHTSYDRSYTYLGVRGFGRPGDFTSRVLLLVDGQPINDGIYDQAPIGSEFPVDMSLVERIEFVPGAGSVMYGGNALLAVINVVTRSGAGLGKRLQVGVGQGGASSLGVSAGWRDDAGNDGLLAATRERSRGHDLYFESYQAAGANAWSRGLDHEANDRFFAQFRRGGFAASLILHDRTKGLPGGSFGIDLNTPGSRVRDRRMHAHASYDHQISTATGVHGQAYAMEVLYNGEWMYSAVSQPDGMVARGFGGEASVTTTALSGHTLLAGISLRRDTERRQFSASLNSNTPRSAIGIFVQDDIALVDRVILSAGLRYDEVRAGTNYQYLSPRLALIMQAGPNTVVKAISGTAFRPPNAYETDYAFTGTNIANPALRSERNRTDELGVVHEFGGDSSLSGSLYRTRIRDLISIERDPTTNLQQHHNVGRVDARGIELEASSRIGIVSVRGGLSWQRVRHEGGADVANTPAQLAKLVLDAPMPGGLRLGWESHYVGTRTTDSGLVGTTGVRIGGYGVSHATLTGNMGRDTEWQFRLHNVFDRAYGNVVGSEYNTNFPGVQQSPMTQMPQDRRRVSATLRWTF
ncbi:MAG: TonB-dependent receptor [Rhodocyclales bacterium]|nr:TonB-dependent receptor [Rhodocyclales bacterium]